MDLKFTAVSDRIFSSRMKRCSRSGSIVSLCRQLRRNSGNPDGSTVTKTQQEQTHDKHFGRG
ncbi:hypothetical protein Pan258_19500 [Symmachiella dynata]|uniref:Uncharacterized protein n=1 Tax=Symmachiella dynata TaxID=2527995 RepID=A0A517ZM02_9PLAN|nr:hypothetical protein Pan258_19500 [Symmachiella dynata]QDU43513.1 hypothetical protein Mal52_19890 [Symmachiella dynata]